MALSNPAPTLSAAAEPQQLAALKAKAHPVRHGLAYAGDISPEDAYEFLASNAAVMVDVRTVPEWQFVGLPDLAATKSKLATISWKHYPDFAPNTQFAAEISALAGVSKDTPLLFLCRSGGRSLDAALAMTQAGYRHCFNIEGGFEGEPDSTGRRGTTQGWKAKKLPWKQG